MHGRLKKALSLSVGLMGFGHIALAGTLADGPIDGFGDTLPLTQVAHDVVPQGVAVEFGDKVDKTQPVSWTGGPSWQTSLKDAIEPTGLVLTVTDNRVVIDTPPPPKETWEVYDGELVSNTVARWATKAGYTTVPVFTSQDKWRLFVNQTFSGDFQEALEWLSSGFATQATKPVAKLGSNKTIDIISVPTGVNSADATTGRF